MPYTSAGLDARLAALHERGQAHRQAAHDATDAAAAELRAELETRAPASDVVNSPSANPPRTP